MYLKSFTSSWKGHSGSTQAVHPHSATLLHISTQDSSPDLSMSKLVQDMLPNVLDRPQMYNSRNSEPGFHKMKQNFTIVYKIRKVFTNEQICSDLFFYAPGGAPGLSRSRIWGPVPGFGPPIPGFGPPVPGFGPPVPGFGTVQLVLQTSLLAPMFHFRDKHDFMLIQIGSKRVI